MKKNFSGPFFIVGVGRSGTKLLRDLMNRNPGIGIPVIESNFIPHAIQKYGNPPKFKNDREFENFYKYFKNTNFYWLSQRAIGRMLKKEQLAMKADVSSWASIIEVILKYYAPSQRKQDFIWGDKTPNYLGHMGLLKEIYPEARFLHIIRDPRDVILSQKKTWEKNPFRAANSWRELIIEGQESGRQLGRDYKEIHFESLLRTTDTVIKSICDYLECGFDKNMTTLDKPSENYGDARGCSFILNNNMNKYINKISASKLKRIEEIVKPVAESLGYKMIYGAKFKPLNYILSYIYRLANGLADARHYIKNNGFYRGLLLLIKEMKESMSLY
jgi:hypothetical protein